MRIISFFSLLIFAHIVLAQNEVADRKAAIQTALSQAVPIIFYQNKLNTEQLQAQEIALADSRVQEPMYDKESKKPLLSEVFGIYPARESDLSMFGAQCKNGKCYRIEIYNFALNLATVVMVDLVSAQVLAVNYYPQSQPDLPPHLVKLAMAIAVASPEVVAAYGEPISMEKLLMSGTKTALNRSRCERSLHLCVAPTLVKADKALWTIVDLTDLKVVGVRWTNVSVTGLPVTERKLQNEKIMECFCEKENKLEKDAWKMNYMLTSSDGLRISEVYFGEKKVINDAKMVDWHVSYSNTEGFGYSDAIGCPMFSYAAVVAIEAPQILPLLDGNDTVGFVLQQTFQSEGWPTACNYNYQERFEFYKDGRFRLVIGSLGRGCGNDGTYRPVTRISFTGNENNFAEWTGKDWQLWTQEKWQLQKPQTSYTTEGYQFRIADKKGNGFFVMPGNGQFGDGGRGDFAYTYVTKHHFDKDEGDTDLLTIGPCCNIDYHQGPDKFIEPKPDNIENTDLVFWYVPQLKNDNTPGKEYCWAESVVENGQYVAKVYPCFSGAMFVPIK